MEFKTETIPSYRIAYIRQTGPYGTRNTQVMEELKHWAGSHHLLDDEAIILGIAQDDPAATRPERCRYDACLVIRDDLPTDARVRCGTLSGGKYAVFTIDHTSAAMQRAWSEVLPELQRLGYSPDMARPVLERYAANMVARHLCEICVPVE